MSTDLVCWWCVHSLPQHPCVHLPLKYDDRRNRFTTIGNFCSWECAKAYAIDMRSPRWGEIQSLLSMMRMRAYKKYMPLFAAPKREALKIFGGTMTIEEFRSCAGGPAPVVYLSNDIQIHQIVAPQDQPVVGSSSNQNSKLKAIEETAVKSETLKLKRSKPLERSKSKLESSLGIIRKSK
jgi:MYM-type Zinc finger with FCS sequence motif